MFLLLWLFKAHTQTLSCALLVTQLLIPGQVKARHNYFLCLIAITVRELLHKTARPINTTMIYQSITDFITPLGVDDPLHNRDSVMPPVVGRHKGRVYEPVFAQTATHPPNASDTPPLCQHRPPRFQHLGPHARRGGSLMAAALSTGGLAPVSGCARAHARAHARTYAACEAGGHTQGAPVKTLVLFTAKQSDSNR